MDQVVDERRLAQEGALALDRALAEEGDLTARIRLVVAQITGRLAFSTSLGLEDQVLLHAIANSNAAVDTFFLDTGRHFPETLETLDASELRFGLRIRVLAPEAPAVEQLVARDGVLGFRHSIEARQACCHVRKVEPLKRALAGAGCWITGLRRGQYSGRANVPFAAWDAEHGLIKVSPLADWSTEQIGAYVAGHDIPVNPLHAHGFASVGCQPCTRAIKPGEDIRAGRWWWEQEDGKECGLHTRPRRLAEAAT